MPSLVRSNQLVPRYLTQEEVARYFAVVTDLRDRALFALVYHYGLRVSEVALHVKRDIDLERHRILVKRVKGGQWAERPLFGATESLVREHLATVPLDSCASLFPGCRGPLRKRQIQSLFTRYRDLAGLPPRYGAHSLRHSIATHLLDAGASLEFVQDHLGHRKIESTSIYARITDRHREAVFRQLEQSPWIVYPAVVPAGPSSLEAPS